jgi:hypothetical protein
MGKSKRSQAKKQHWASKAPPTSLLRPRLDSLWSQEDWFAQDEQACWADLDQVVKDIPPSLFLRTLMKSHLAASPQTRAQLHELLPSWLRERGYLETLKDLLAKAELDNVDREIAMNWLQATGVDTAALTVETPEDHFCRANYFADEFGSQAVLIIFWYHDRQHRRVRGFNFLIDFNPPWEGAVKDIMFLPVRSPDDAVRQFVDIWEKRGMKLQSITAEEAKRKVVESFLCNRKQNIRLPQDLISHCEYFLRYVLTLPNAPETPTFTNEDFNALIHADRTPESIMAFEQNVGRRVRMDDGKEVLVMGDPFDEWDE